jgi:hypothetical protein
MAKADIRLKCRTKWGKNWHNVHPVIKKARLQWAAGERLSDTVRVVEGGETYWV